jgi:hypothetical protein
MAVKGLWYRMISTKDASDKPSQSYRYLALGQHAARVTNNDLSIQHGKHVELIKAKIEAQ